MNVLTHRASHITFHASRFTPFILLLLICTMLPSGATAGVNMIMLANDAQSVQQEEEEEITVRFQMTIGGEPLQNEPLTFSVSPDDGTAFLALFTSSTDANGDAMFILRFRENASGTYKVTVRLDRFSNLTFGFNIIYSETSGPTVASSTTTTPPPEPSKLVKISADNQIAAPGDSVTFTVELQDSDGDPISGVDLNFILFGDDETGSLSPEIEKTDAKGRVQTTLQLSNDAAGTYEIEAYRNDNFGVYVGFTVTVDPSPPTAARLEKISGGDQSGFTGESLANPFVVEVRDQFDDPLEGATVTFAITAGDGSLNTTTGMTDQDGRAGSTLTLGADPGANTVEVSVEGISQTETFSAEATVQPPTPTRLQSVIGDNQDGSTDETLMDPFVVEILDQDGDPLEDVPVTFTILGDDGSMRTITEMTDEDERAEFTLPPGSDPGTYTVTASVEGITQTVTFTAVAVSHEFDLSLPTGFNLIHVPLKVRVVDGTAQTIESVGDLYDGLGGADTVNWLITHDPETQTWYAYFGDADRGSIADRMLTDQTGILADIKTPVSVRLGGDAFGTNGMGAIALHPGLNLVGLPLRDARITRVSDLLGLEGSANNLHIIVVTEGGVFKAVGRAGDSGDIPVTGGQGFLLFTSDAGTIPITGTGWDNVP